MKQGNNLVCIYKVYDSIEAELIKSHLESEGIMSFLKSDNAGGSLAYLNSILDIEIIVLKEDVEKALEIIQHRKSS